MAPVDRTVRRCHKRGVSNTTAINAAAADLANNGKRANLYGGDVYVWICDVAAALAAQNPGWTAEQIKAEIAADPRMISTARADLVGALDPVKLAASETRVRTSAGVAHYIVVA